MDGPQLGLAAQPPTISSDLAFYAYSGERYELSVFPSGVSLGPPEEDFQVSAEAYLQ